MARQEIHQPLHLRGIVRIHALAHRLAVAQEAPGLGLQHAAGLQFVVPMVGEVALVVHGAPSLVPLHGAATASKVPPSSAAGSRVASTLSMVRPSMSTISSRQPSQLTLSATRGMRPVSSIIMPLRVW